MIVNLTDCVTVVAVEKFKFTEIGELSVLIPESKIWLLERRSELQPYTNDPYWVG